jgi:hypothetical protein
MYNLDEIDKCGSGPKGLFAVVTSLNNISYLSIGDISDDLDSNTIDA